MPQSQRFLWFDLIRGVSAFAVCAGHLRAVVFQDYAVQGGGPFWQAFYFATGLGHQAVMVFFVLSGFFVGGSVLKKGRDFEFGDYAIARLTRLWTVLLPALAVTAVMDLATHAINPAVVQGAFFDAWSSGPRPGDFSIAPGTWLANVFFLQTVASPVFGTNGPLWSLANEFWYYLMFPLGVVAMGVCGRTGTAGRAIAAVLVVACLVSLPAGITVSFLVWMFGVGVWLAAARGLVRRGGSALAWAGLGLFALALGASKRPGLLGDMLPSDFLIGIGFTVLALGLASLPSRRAWPRPLAAVASAASEFSYSLYLVHFPIVVLIGAAVYGDHPRAAGPRALAEYLGWLALLVAVGAGFWWTFERRTQEVRRYVSALIARVVPAASPVARPETVR